MVVLWVMDARVRRPDDSHHGSTAATVAVQPMMTKQRAQDSHVNMVVGLQVWPEGECDERR